MTTSQQQPLATSSAGEPKYDFMYYLKGAAAGGICCSITHGALTPVDVVKTRVQLDPVKVRKTSLKNIPHRRGYIILYTDFIYSMEEYWDSWCSRIFSCALVSFEPHLLL